LSSCHHDVAIAIATTAHHLAYRNALCVQAIMLRRTKQSTFNGQPIISLPPRQQQLMQPRFSTQQASSVRVCVCVWGGECLFDQFLGHTH
jgi:hypothetical protein